MPQNVISIATNYDSDEIKFVPLNVGDFDTTKQVSAKSFKAFFKVFASIVWFIEHFSADKKKNKELKKMVNMPMNLCAYATDKPNGFVTDINQNINQEYYEWLLKQHNYFPDCAFHKVSARLCFSIDIDSV